MINSETLYDRTPIWTQNAAVSAYGAWVLRRRYGGRYGEVLGLTLGRNFWSRSRILEYQGRRVRKLIQHCYANVPYYHRKMKELGLTPADFHTAADLKLLPLLTKDIVRSRQEELLATGERKREIFHVHTSGTTGAGLKFIIDRVAHQEQWAVWWRYRINHGINPGTWCAYFGGRAVVPVDQQCPPFWRVNWPARQVLYSAYHMAQDTLPFYISDLRRRNLPWIHGYPSSLALLARYVLDHGIKLKFRWATVGAENLFAWQKTLIEGAFNCRCFQHYGSAEAVANFSECEAGNLHADDDFCAVELVSTGTIGEFAIIGTCLGNYAMPFVRYETGDICGSPLDECQCGKPGLVVSRIDGRKEDYVILRNGRSLGRLDHIFKDALNIREAQIVQDVPGEIVIKLVRANSWGMEDEQDLLSEFRKRAGANLNVKIAYCEKLARTASGKLRFVVSSYTDGKLESLNKETSITRDV